MPPFSSWAISLHTLSKRQQNDEGKEPSLPSLLYTYPMCACNPAMTVLRFLPASSWSGMAWYLSGSFPIFLTSAKDGVSRPPTIRQKSSSLRSSSVGRRETPKGPSPGRCGAGHNYEPGEPAPNSASFGLKD
jgi:hypothetical protein